MCGIVGLFCKTDTHRHELGRLTAVMLREMRDRGPDSAGFASYDPGAPGRTPHHRAGRGASRWTGGRWPPRWRRCSPPKVAVRGRARSCGVLHRRRRPGRPPVDHRQRGRGHRAGLRRPDRAVQGGRRSRPGGRALRPGLPHRHPRPGPHPHGHRVGGHHQRARTRSPPAPTPVWCTTGRCPNHNRLRRFLEGHGESFQTENDSEVAAGYLSWRMRSGDTISQALEGALDDLDGFYTFAIGVADGFAHPARTRSPASRRWWPRPTTGWPCRRSTGP